MNCPIKVFGGISEFSLIMHSEAMMQPLRILVLAPIFTLCPMILDSITHPSSSSTECQIIEFVIVTCFPIIHFQPIELFSIID